MEFVNQLGLLALGSRMRALSDRLYVLADEAYQRHGIPIQGRWFPILRLLHDRGPSTVGEIAEATGQTHSAVSQLADRLAREGWLQTQADTSDKRVRRLALTAQSEAALRDAKPIWRAIEDVLVKRCNEADIDMLGTLSRFAEVAGPDIGDEIAARTLEIQREGVRVEPFRPQLREHFYRLNADWLRKYFYIEEIDHQVLSHPEEEILAPGGEIFFALLGDEVIGTCALKQEGRDACELTKMAVDERYQGLGIGRRLIEAAIAEFRRRAVEQPGLTLFLETNTKLAPAIRLYETVGFEHQASLKPDSHYSRADVYMVWRDAQARDTADGKGKRRAKRAA